MDSLGSLYKMRTRIILLVSVWLAAGAPLLHAFVYSETFFSMHTDIDIPLTEDSDPDDLTSLESSLFDIDAVSLVVSWGPPAFPLDLRLRGGMGWFPRESVRLIAGIELPVFERLNRFKAVSFGVYLAADAIMGVSKEGAAFSGKVALSVLLPLASIGGILCGVGVNHRGAFSLILGTIGGGYPVVIVENGGEPIGPDTAPGGGA